jgi:hypothetical protein
MLFTSFIARLGFATSAALVFSAACEAQFSGVLSNADSTKPRRIYTIYDPIEINLLYGSGRFDQWNFSAIDETRAMYYTVDTTSPDSMMLSVRSDFPFIDFPGVAQLMMVAPLGQGTLRFDFSFVRSDVLYDAGFAAYTLDGGTTWQDFGPPGTADNFTLMLGASDIFGVRVTDYYSPDDGDMVYSHDLTLSEISFTAAPIPEPAGAGVLAGLAALGFVTLGSRGRAKQAA